MRGAGRGEKTGGRRQDQLCRQVRERCRQRCERRMRESGGRQEAGRCGQEQLYPEVREDGGGGGSGGQVREGGRRQEAGWRGQEQLCPEVREG